MTGGADEEKEREELAEAARQLEAREREQRAIVERRRSEREAEVRRLRDIHLQKLMGERQRRLEIERLRALHAARMELMKHSPYAPMSRKTSGGGVACASRARLSEARSGVCMRDRGVGPGGVTL